MFSEKLSAGKHLICDLKDIKNIELLNSSKLLCDMMENICAVCEFEVLKKISHNFLPIGCSIIFLLSESHISVHTFPERNHISFDLYSCREYNDNSEYEIIFNFLLVELNASIHSSYKIIDRSF